MTDSGSRRGAANLAPILMILSFLAMAGLLVWLSAVSEGTEPVTMEEEPETDSVEAAATLVTREELRTGTDSLVGETIRLENAPVATTLGRNAFMVELGEQGQSSPFLVVLDSALIAGGGGIPEGTATVAGMVRVRSDSILDAWIESGVIPESQRVIADFSSHFIDATRLRGPGQPAGGPGSQGGPGDDGEGGGGAGEGSE